MASNNSHRTQQQSWVPKGGGGLKKAVSSTQHQPEIIFNARKQDVIHTLQDMFLDVLDLDVIQSVAQNCEFNLHASIEALMMLSEDVDIHQSPALSSTLQLCNAATSAAPQTKKLSIPELPLQAKTRSETKRPAFLGQGSLVQNSHAVTRRDRASSPAQGAIKVTYKSPSNCEESDSDADVVVEEEKEYDMCGGSVNVSLVPGSFSRLEVPSSLMPQSMTHLSHGYHQGKAPSASKKTAQMPPVSVAVIKLPNIKTSVDQTSKKLSSAHMAQQKQVRPPTIQERVQKLIQDGTRVMVLMRGAPGSGKSYLAKEIIRLTMGSSCNPSSYIFSTDDFFVRTQRFIPCLLQQAHSWNQERVRAASERKWSPIFVDNTNTEVWEMKPYAEFAVKNGYVLELVEPSTPWRYQESHLARRNVHGVPYQQIQVMLARFEKNLSGKLLITKLRLKYSAGNKPPQPAANPLPPQVKQKVKKKKKAQTVAVIPLEVKPKRKRKRKSKTVSQVSQVPEQPSTTNHVSPLMDTLAVFLAKKALEEGRTLDPEIANSRLNNGVTVSDVLLQEKQGVPQSAGSYGGAKVRSIHDSLASEGSAVNMLVPVDVNEQVEIDSSSGDDSSDDDNEDDDCEEEEEESDIDNDEVDPETKDLGEWQVDDHEWLYESDDNAEEDEEQNGADNPVSVGSEVQCWEYILVTDDSKWVYQKHHPETQCTEVQEDTDATTEQTEGLLIDLSAGTADMSVSENTLNAEHRPGPETSNLLIDILNKAGDNLENGVQQLLSPMNIPIAPKILTKQSVSEVAIPSQPFSLAEFDQWLSTVPVETGAEAIHWEASSLERNAASSAVMESMQESIGIKAAALPMTEDVTGRAVELGKHGLEISPIMVPLTAPPVSEDVSDKAKEVCPVGLEDSTNVVPSDPRQLMQENTEGHLLSATHTLLAECPKNSLFLHEGTELELTFAHGTPEPCGGVYNEEKCHVALGSQEAADRDKDKKNVEANDRINLASVKPVPSYDLRTWVMKCNEKEAREAEKVLGQEDLLVICKEVQRKPDDLCGPREQRFQQKAVERKMKQVSDAGVLKTEALPPELQLWDTVPEPSGSWENKHTEQEEHKLSAGPRPQRSVFASEESYQMERIGSGKCLVSSRTPTLLTPDDFIQCSWENRLVSELQNSHPSAVDHDCDVMDSAVDNVDSSTNTHYKDFTLMSQLNRQWDVPEPLEGIRIITGHNRSISEGVSPHTVFDRPVPFTLTLDKSSMTNEEDITTAVLGSSQAINEERNRKFMHLVTIFPNAPHDGLKEIFEKCCGDLNWAIDLLLESKMEQFTPVAPPKDAEDSVFQELSFPISNVSDAEPPAPPVKADDMVSLCNFQSTRAWRRGNGSKAPLSEQSQQLKQHLEKSVTLSDTSYSEHTLRIRKLWHGEPLDMGEVTTKPEPSPQNSTVVSEESCLGAIGSTGTRTPTPQSRDALDVQRDEAAVDSDLDSSSSGTEEEDMLPLTLDSGFVTLLYQKFGDPYLPYSEGLEPVVNLPLPLARQIHYYLVETQLLLQEQQQKQMEQMLQEDEELARQLQEQEDKQQGSPGVANLQEIMDMEVALALYRSDEAQLQGKEAKDDLATKLKKQKLCELFPSLDKDVLLEVFAAHKNSFESTVEEVMASTGDIQDEHAQTVIAPEALVARRHSLMEQAKQEQCKVDQESKSGISKALPIVVVRDPVPADLDNTVSLHQKAMKVVEQYRTEARLHWNMRSERIHKAKEAFNKGNTAVASYYLQMATLHKQRMDKANAEAVTFLQSAHTVARDKVTLDLHYYQIPEALQVLDVFLDQHIASLAEKHTKKNLFIITGRGVHSSGGKSRIRPAVECRLKSRGLKWSIVNPGLLKVVVKSHFPMSHTVSTNS